MPAVLVVARPRPAGTHRMATGAVIAGTLYTHVLPNPVEHRPNGFEISAWRIVEALDAGIWDAGDVVCCVLDRLVKDQARVRVDERTEEAPSATRMPQVVLAPSVLRRKQIGDCIKLFEQIALLLIMECHCCPVR